MIGCGHGFLIQTRRCCPCRRPRAQRRHNRRVFSAPWRARSNADPRGHRQSHPPGARRSPRQARGADGQPASAAGPQPSDLPVWEDVASDHPSGATNPPRPVLVALADGSRCWKQWVGGMMRPDPQVLKLGGRVVTTAAEVDNATEIQCPADRMDQLLGAHRGE